MSAPAEIAEQLVSSMRKSFRRGLTLPLEWRMEQLRRLGRMLEEKEAELVAALREDLGRPEGEANVELQPLKVEVRNAAKSVGSWAKPLKVPTNFSNLPGSSEIVPEPLGVVLIISPWNIPIDLAISPLIGALAAGNVAVLKPSEIAPACSTLLASILPQYLDPAAVQVVEGGADVAVALLEQKWDKIFFTGGAAVGRSVAMAAAKNLTPVVLELGGKNPVFVDASVDFEVGLKRLASFMCFNAGQTCLAPDYLLVERSVVEQVTDRLRSHLTSFYGTDPSKSHDFGRIVSTRHFDRLQSLLTHPDVADRIVFGGSMDRESRYIAPTLLRDVPWDAPIMLEETFGPVVAIQTVSGVEEALEVVNSRPKPLALYVFSQKSHVVDRFVAGTSSGAVVANDVSTHFINPALPFGGVGPSGVGAYHGKHSFDCFTHQKAVLRKGTLVDVPFRYPPSTSLSRGWMKALLSVDVVGIVLLALGLRR